MPRTSLTLPAETLEDVKFVSRRLGITRSALISELLVDVLGPLKSMLLCIPEDPADMSPDDVKRLRGESADIIRSRIKELKEQDHDLFSDL